MKKSKIPVLVKKDSISKKTEKSISRKAESSQKEHSKSNDKSSRFKNSEATENVYTPESTVPTNEHSHENPCLEDNTKEPKYKKNTVSTKKKIKKIRKGSPKKTKDDKEEIGFQRKSSIKTENIPKVLHNDADLNAKISDIYSGKNDVNQVTEIKGEKCESLPIIESNLKTEIYKIKVESQTNQSNLIDSNVLSAKKGNFKTLSEKNGEESSKISVHLPKKIPSIKNSLNTSDFEGHNTLVSIHKNVPEPFSEKSQAIKKICSRKNSFVPLNVIENEETPSVKLGEKSDPKTIASNLQSTVNTTHEKTFDSNIIHNRTTNGSNNLKTSIKSTEKSESELLKSNILSSTTSVTPIEMEEKIIRIGLNDRKLSLKSVGTELQEKHVFPNIKSYSRRNSSITCTDDATTMTLVDKEALVNSELLKKDHLTPKKSKSKRNSSIIQLHTKNGTRRGSVDRKSSSKQTKNKDLESVKNNILPYTRPLCEINSSINHINTKPTVGLTNGRTSVNSIYSETSKKDSLSSIKPLSRRNSSIIQIDAEHADRKTSANLIDSESLKGDLLLPLHRRNSVVIEIDAETTSGLVNRKKSSKSVDSKRETLSPKKIHSRRNSSIDEVSKIVVDASVSKIDNILQLSSVSQNKKIPSRRNSTIEIFQKFIGIDSQSKSDRNEYVLTIDDVPRTSIPTEENKPVHLGINLSDTGENQRKSDILDYKFKEPSSSSKDEKDHTNYKEIKKDVIIRSQKSDLETDVLSEVKPISSNNSTITNIINNEPCKSSTLSVDNEDSSFNTTKTTENTDSLSRESSMKVSRETSKLMEDNHHNKKLSIARRKSLKIIELSDGKSSSKKRSKSFDSIGSESTAHLSVPPIEALSEVNVLPNERSISLIPVNKEPENNDSIETVKSEVQKMLNQKVSKNDKLDLLQSLLASLANEDDFESSEIPNSDLVQPSRMENVNQRTYPPITEVGEELPNLEQTASEKSDHQIQNESHNSDGTVMKSLVVESKSDQEEERIDNLQTQYSIIESSQELTDKTANVKELEVLETDETSIVESIDKIKTSRKESVLCVGQQSFESSSEKKVRDESNVDDDESSSDCDDILDSNETPLVLNLEKMELSPKKYSQYEVGSNSSNSLEGSEIESSEEEEYVSEFGLVTDDDTGSNVEKNVQTDNEVKENVFQDDGSDREESLESEYELESFDSENEREKEEELESEYEIEEEEELECEYVLEEEEDLESEYEFEEEEELESEHKSKEEEELKSEHKSKEEEKLESEHYSKEEDELESEHKSMDEEELEFENKFEEEEELESEHKSEEEEELESEHKSEEEEELEFNHEPEQVVLDEDNRGDDQADKVSLIIDVKSLTPKEDSISELDESLEHDISSSLEKALESIETLKVLQKRLSIDLESINVKKSLIDAETVKTERLENDGNLINVNYGINVSELEQCSKSSPIVDQGSRAVEGGITQDLVVVDKEVILVKDKELFVEKNSDSLENIMENKGIHLSDSKTFIEEDKHKLEIQLFSNNGNSDKINETTEDLIIHTSTKEDETKKALDKILHLMEKLARRSSLLSEENRRKNVNTPLKEDIQDNRRCSSSMSMHEESQVLQVIKTIDREIHSSSRKQSIISNTSSKSNIIEIIGDVEEVIQEKGEYEERLSLRSSLSPDHQLSDGKNVSPISDTMEIDCQVSKEDAFLNEKEKTSLKASRSSSLEIEDKKIRPECTEDVKKDLNIDPQRDFAKEVEVALENIIEMKSTMTKMMALLEKTSLDQRKPYNDTDSVRSLISQISLYSDMVQDIMPVIQEKDTEDPLCLLDRSSGRRASTISLIEEKSSSTLPSPPSFTAFYDESPNIMEEVNVSSIQVQKHKSYDKLNEKEDTNIKAEVSSKIDEKMKFFDNLSKIPLIRGGDTEKMNNLDSLMVKKSTILEGVSEDSLLPVSKQRQVFEREAMKAMFEEVSIQKQVPGKVSDSEFAPWVLPKNYGLSESLTHNPFIYNDPIHKRITKSAEDLSKCGLCHEEKIVNHLGISCSLCKKEQGLQSHSGNVINSVSMQNIAQSPIFIIKVQDAESQTFEDEFDNGNILYDNYSKLSDKLRKSSLISRGTNETIEKEKSSSIKGDQSPMNMESKDMEESSPNIFEGRRYDSLKDSNAFPCEDLSEYDMGEEEFIRSNSSVLISSPHDTALPVETIEKAISPFSPHDFEESIYNNMNAVRRRSESNLKTKLFKLSVSMDDLDQTDSLTISFSGSNINISSSSQLLAKSNIDISSGEFGTHLTLRPNLKRSLSNTSSRLKDEIEIPESIHRNEDVRTVIEEELLEMKTETDYDEEEEDSGAETVIETKRPPSSNEYLKDRFEFDLPPSKLYYFDDDPLNSPPKELKVEDTYSLEESYIFGTKPERKSPSPIQSHSSEEIMIDQQSPSEMDDDMMEDKRADHEGASNETLSSLLDSVRVNENKFEINDRDFQNYEDDISQESRDEDETFDDDSCVVEEMAIGKYTRLNRRPIVSRPRKFLRFSSQVGGHKESDISNKESKLYKILFIGSSSAGKTSIIRRYVKHTFTPSYRATIGADFLSKVIHWDEAVTLRLQLWDIAGQDRFSLLSRSFYKDAVGAFIVCDISRPDTLDACIPWKEELDAKVQTSEGGKLPCFLLANKCDLVEDSTAQSKLTSKVCQMHGFHGWMQTSAKEDINITQAIEMLLRQIVKQDIDSTPFATDQESLVLENEGRKKKRSGCLC